jgi:hypothetical protein
MEYFQPAIENRMKIPRKADPAAKTKRKVQQQKRRKKNLTAKQINSPIDPARVELRNPPGREGTTKPGGD